MTTRLEIKEVCPWLAISGEAGSKEYAESTREWMQEEFGGTWVVREENGWHWSEEVSGALE